MCFTGIEAAGHQRNAVEEGGREGGREEASVREGGL